MEKINEPLISIGDTLINVRHIVAAYLEEGELYIDMIGTSRCFDGEEGEILWAALKNCSLDITPQKKV